MKINNPNNVALLLIILGAVLFFTFVMPIIDKNYYDNQTKENFNALLNNTTNNEKIFKLDQNKCSTSCCGLSQWPVPSEILDNSIPPDELKNYIPSNFGCASGNYSGCVCLTQQNSDYLNSHGNNTI